MRPGNHRPSARWRLAIRNQHHSRDGHILTLRGPGVIKNPPCGQFERKVVFIGRFRAYEFAWLAGRQRRWRVVKARPRKGIGRPECFGLTCGLSVNKPRFPVSPARLRQTAVVAVRNIRALRLSMENGDLYSNLHGRDIRPTPWPIAHAKATFIFCKRSHLSSQVQRSRPLRCPRADPLKQR